MGSTQAEQIAFSRGVCAKQRGEGKKDCPYDDDSPWYEAWHQGFQSAAARTKQRRDE
jgi:hypothetical protein